VEQKDENFYYILIHNILLENNTAEENYVTVGDKDDVFAERINTVLLLFLGVLLVTASAVLVTYSTILLVGRHQFLMEFLKTVAITAPLLVIGSGLLYRQFKKYRLGRVSNSFTQAPSGPLCVLCEDCGTILYEDTKPISQDEIIERYSGRCPGCGKELR